jgi:hypothetical protein
MKFNEFINETPRTEAYKPEIVSVQDDGKTITIKVRGHDGAVRAISNSNPAVLQQQLNLKYGLRLPHSIARKFAGMPAAMAEDQADNPDSWQSQAADAERDKETVRMADQDAKAGGLAEQAVDEDLRRRGFLQGLGAAALGAAGLGASGAAQARATPAYMQAYSKAKSKFEAGYDIGQVARALGVSGPNNNMVGPMGGEWGAINKAAQEMGVRNQDAPVAPSTQSRPSAEKQNPVTAEYQRLSIMALRFSLTNPKFEQEYAPIETQRNRTMDTLINGTSGKLSANPAIAQRQRIAIVQYMDDANSEYIQKTTALLKQYGALKEQAVAEGDLNEKSTSQAQFRTMAAAAHNPKFAKKVGISPDVAQEFHGADRKQNYKSLPKKAAEDASWGMAPEGRGYKK